MNILETIQCRFTKLFRGLDHMMCKERLREMHLLSIKEEGLRSA